MATENVGAIQYTVDADTAAMLKAEAVVNKSISNQVKQFDKADQAVRDFIVTQEKLGRTVNSMGQVMNSSGNIVANATQQYRALAATAQSGFDTLNTKISGTAKAVRGARPDMQNMSYQLQDMAVQAQMGTSAFVIMAQQLPQMLVGMGAWAGAIGVVVTVLGLMATTMIDTTSDMEKLEKAIEQVKAVITVGSNGIATYSDEMKKLSNISKELLQIKLNTALAAQRNAFKLAGEAAKQAYEDATPFFNLNWEAYKNQQEAVFDNIIDDKELKKLGMAHPLMDSAMNGVYGLNSALTSIKNGNLDAGIERITAALGLLSNSAAQNTKEGRALITTLTDVVAKYKEGAITVEQLTNAINGNGESFKGNADALQSFLQEIHLSNTNMLDGERAALKLRLGYEGMTDAQIDIAMAAYDYNQKLVKQKQATEDAIEADKKRKKSLDDVNASLDAFFEKESADDKKKSERETTNNINFAQNIIESGKTPEQRMAEQYARLDELRQTDLENAEVYQEAMTALELQAQENRENELSESYRRIGEAAADSMGDYLSGAKTAEEATRQLASTIISQAIQSLVQMGITAMTQTAATTTAATGGIAATTTAAVTSTGVMAGAQGTAMATVAGAVGTIAGGLAASWAPAAAFASLATLGTNSGPAIAGIYATMAATLGAQLVGGLASNAIEAGTGFAGAREFGGPVTAGKSYLVGERGPEMITMGASGQVTSNKDLMSGSSGVSVNINNYSGQNVTQNYDEVRKIVTVEIGKQISGIRSGTGLMAKALKGTTTTKGRATKA